MVTSALVIKPVLPFIFNEASFTNQIKVVLVLLLIKNRTKIGQKMPLLVSELTEIDFAF